MEKTLLEKDNKHQENYEMKSLRTTEEKRNVAEQSRKGKSITQKMDNIKCITNSKEYSISKIIKVPPYTSVKISSYINWINDLRILFNISLKFSVESYRMKNDGSLNIYWSTMDKNLVSDILRQFDFHGHIVHDNEPDSVVAKMTGSFTGSMGLESVFVVQEKPLNDLIGQ